jgi:hypothetical protein
VSEPAVSIAFFDPAHGLHGTARAGATVLFEGASSRVLAEGPRLERRGGGWRAELEQAFSLELEPVAAAVELGGVTAQVCGVSGRVGQVKVSCLGTVAETAAPPAWSELDAIRSVSALFDRGNAFLAVAKRPRNVPGHGHEDVSAWLLHAGERLDVEDARISTVYDGDARQRSAGLELWLPEEDLPRRLSGTVVAGSSLKLERIDVHAAVFRWRMDDREGFGAYELAVRREDEAA